MLVFHKTLKGSSKANESEIIYMYKCEYFVEIFSIIVLGPLLMDRKAYLLCGLPIQ